MTDRKMEPYFGRDGLFTKSLHGFEHRALQLDMANAVSDCLSREIPLLVEAGTGTGKTWAYLAPVIESGRKTVISTGSKALQDQIFDQDIPLLKKLCFPQCNAVCIKGRNNYLCLRRLRDFSYQSSFHKKEEAKLYHRLQQWATRTKTGERSEMPWLPDSTQIWRSVNSVSEHCLGQKCVEHARCFMTRLRQDASRANLIVVNHHLFFADLALRAKGLGEVIPDYKAVVFDEAHQLEDVIGLYFGLEFSNMRAQDLARDARSECRRSLAQPGKSGLRERAPEIEAGCGQIEILSRQMHQLLAARKEARFRLGAEAFGGGFAETSDRMSFTLRELSARLSPFAEDQSALALCGERAVELANGLDALLSQRDPSLIYWCEISHHGFSLRGTPVELAPILQERLFERTTSVVFTSATISTGGSCGFIRERLGIPPESREMVLPSPFAVEEQALLYIPKAFPMPNEPSFTRRMADEALKILHKTRGRALFLFTSHRQMQQTHPLLKDHLPYPILVQGEKPPRTLLAEFKENVESVLLATKSFWEGIDVPGESLSCVLIDKLPFEVPDDPITAARIDALTRQGKSAFTEYQVPRAIIHLKQGVGRLLRSSSDRGLIVIFDVRLRTKNYGRTFLKSLPPYRIASGIDEIAAFFAAQEGPEGWDEQNPSEAIP